MKVYKSQIMRLIAKNATGPELLNFRARCDLKTKEARKNLLLKRLFPFAQCYYSTLHFILQPFLPIY